MAHSTLMLQRAPERGAPLAGSPLGAKMKCVTTNIRTKFFFATFVYTNLLKGVNYG